MGCFEQSPVLKYNGEKFKSPHGWGKAIRTHELEAAINCCLGEKEFAMAKIMYFLTGNAEGFRVSEKTILDRCNISESGYKKARKKLIEKQWIFHKPGEYIQVNFNKIYSDYKALQERGTQETSQGIEKNQEGCVSTLDEVSSVNTPHITENTKSRYPEYTYNNINNNIRDNIKNTISEKNRIMGSCEDTRFAANAASQVSSQSLREIYHTKEEINKAEREFHSWFGQKIGLIEGKYDMNDNEQYRKMYESEEYKAFQIEADARREALKKEYGKYIRV